MLPALSCLAMALYSNNGAIKRIVKVIKIANVMVLPYPDLSTVISESLLYNPSPTPAAIDPIMFNKMVIKSKLEADGGRPEPGLESYV
jgi:hypothetical protein